MMVVALGAAVTAILLGMMGITLSNLALFPRLRGDLTPSALPSLVGKGDGGIGAPFISILIPARDEAAIIGETVRRMLAQSYPRFELIVLDDHSGDGTAEIARAAAGGDARLRVVSGAALPAGWGGKNWACHQLAETAKGDWLIFIDADTIWAPDALTALAAEMGRTRADLLTIWPTQITATWPERLVVPLMAMAVIGYLPVFMTHHTPWASFAAATGQCMAFRRAAYDAVGGHAALRAEVLEDVKFARRIKAHRLRLRMADGNRLIACRMYSDWPSVRDGYAKNILAGYGSLVALALATVFHWLVFLFPWAWLALGWVAARSWKLEAGTLVLGLGIRAATAAFSRQRVADALLMPVSAVLMTVVAAKSAYWQMRFGGPVWKGRVLRGK
jgi:chlorobactene glucosyltransferase